MLVGVDPERDLLGAKTGCPDRGKVDDGVGAAQRLDRLSEVRQVGRELRARAVRRGDEVDAEHVVAVLQQVADDGPTGLAAASCDDDARHLSDFY